MNDIKKELNPIGYTVSGWYAPHAECQDGEWWTQWHLLSENFNEQNISDTANLMGLGTPRWFE